MNQSGTFAGIFRASIANRVFLFWISDVALTAATLIIYGHNMMNGTMFAGCKGMCRTFCEQHPSSSFKLRMAARNINCSRGLGQK